MELNWFSTISQGVLFWMLPESFKEVNEDGINNFWTKGMPNEMVMRSTSTPSTYVQVMPLQPPTSRLLCNDGKRGNLSSPDNGVPSVQRITDGATAQLHQLVIILCRTPDPSYDFKLLHAENNSKRCAMSEQTAFDMASNTLQFGFANRCCATKNMIASFSMKPVDMGYNSLTSFLNDEHGTVRTQVSYAKQAENSSYESSSVTGVSRKIFNEHSRNGHRDSQEEMISGQEYIKRLLQAHQVVDELLKSRGLIPEDEIGYLRTFKNTGHLDTVEASQQHCVSNGSNSGLSMDAESENDFRASPKLRKLNLQKFTKGCNKKQQTIGGQTKLESKSLAHLPAKLSKKNFVNLFQNKKLNQDYKMEVETALEQVTLISIRESGTFNESPTNKKHNVFISKSKCETVDVCFCFINEFCWPDKTTISLAIARYTTVRKKSIVISDKRFLEKIEKEQKSNCDKDDSMHVFLLMKTGKLPLQYNSMFPEIQNMEKTSKIIVAAKESEETESRNSFTLIPYLKRTTPNETRETFTNNKQQLCTVTISKNFCQQPKLSQLQTVMEVPVRLHKTKVTKLVMIKQMNNKEDQLEELLKVNNSSVPKKRILRTEESPKTLQNYTAVTQNYYQQTLRSTAGKSNEMTEFERNAGIDIRRVREHLRRINFNKTSVVKLESFVHRINQVPVKLSNTASLETSKQDSSILSVVKKKQKKLSGTKIDKNSKGQSAGTRTTTPPEKRCHVNGTTAERNKEILDNELVNEYRRTQHIPKPQAIIPAWNMHDERKQATVNVWNPPKLRHGTLPIASPVPCFIHTRTPAPVNVAGTLSTTPLSITAVLRHVNANPLPVITSRPKNVLSGGNNRTILSSLQQQMPSNQFGVMLKRVDRVTLQKSKLRGAITQSAPKKPWIPKWRRIQRTEEEEEAETISAIEMYKNENGSNCDEQEKKQMPIQLSSHIAIQKNETDMTEAEKAMMVARKRQIEEETAKLQEYEEKRRIEREREKEELRKLKEKKERRKFEREEEERQFQERLRQEEERRKQEEEKRKAEMEAERRKKEDEKRKRQQMLSSQFTNVIPGQTWRNFVIPQKSDKADKFGNIVQAKQEMSMTKEQQEEAKHNYLVSVKHTIEFKNVAPAELREKIRQLHQRICKLEADKYDLEKRHERQEYDLRELNERQRQVARNKALKRDLIQLIQILDIRLLFYIFQRTRYVTSSSKDATLAPKVSIVSKYDRQIDRRNFKERRAMFENKNAYPCFPNVPPPPTVYEKVILSDDKGMYAIFAISHDDLDGGRSLEDISMQIVMVQSCTDRIQKRQIDGRLFSVMKRTMGSSGRRHTKRSKSPDFNLQGSFSPALYPINNLIWI
ncbi:Troponin [Dirofilaria immitis]|nr:Troponin [Dirofilaria immitis]